MRCFNGRFRNEQGFTLTEIIVVLIIVAILATAAMNRFIDMSKAANSAACKVNQLSLETAETLLNANSLINTGEPHYATDLNELSPYLRDNVLPSCPSGGSYVIGAKGAIFCTIPDHNKK